LIFELLKPLKRHQICRVLSTLVNTKPKYIICKQPTNARWVLWFGTPSCTKNQELWIKALRQWLTAHNC